MSNDLQNNESAAQANQYDFSFTGSGAEYFKIWIVNILLSIATLGIYSAWAKVRNKRYFYGNTLLNNSSFEYHATPIQILKGRIIAFIVFALYMVVSELFPIAGLLIVAVLAIVFPFFIYSSLRFNSVMSSYRNVRFGFNGSLLDCYKYFLFLPFAVALIPIVMIAASGALAGSDNESMAGMMSVIVLLSMLVAYLLIPKIICLIDAFIINSRRYGSSQFETSITGGGYYAIYLKWFLFALLGMIAAGILFGIVVASVINPEALANFDPENIEAIGTELMGKISLFFGLFFILMIFGSVLQAFLISQLRNYQFNHSGLAGLQLQSELSTFKLAFIMISNFLLIAVTLGLFIPWAKVRMAHYVANCTSLEAQSLDNFIADQISEQSALGDEMGEAFDVDMDLGLGV